ncbi:MAG: hypothetical protein M5U35_09095 [Roseovarius sp.]|nr:hypothetical protein [Roseovarius sp.]
MSPDFEFSSTREAYVLEGPVGDTRYRIVVPRDFVEAETGGSAPGTDHYEWLRANLPNILAAYTARIEGGWVKAPWNRVLVVEVD